MCGFCHNRTWLKDIILKRLRDYVTVFLYLCVFLLKRDKKYVNNFFKDSIG